MALRTFQSSNIPAGEGNCQDPDRCLGPETIQSATTGTRCELINHSETPRKITHSLFDVQSNVASGCTARRT